MIIALAAAFLASQDPGYLKKSTRENPPAQTTAADEEKPALKPEGKC
jgi:hypothetical protein